jgi:CRISPR-associated protein Cmr2
MNYEAIHEKYPKQNEMFFRLKYDFDETEIKNSNLNDFKKEIKESKIYQFEDKSQVEKFSNIKNLEEYTKSLLPNSFALQVTFALKSPYYSSDEDEFYLIPNSCLKEKVFKVPMVRGSGWKGALLQAGREIIEESDFNKVEYLQSLFRIFGVGDEEFRKIVDRVDEMALKLFFMQSGLVIDVNDDVKRIFERYKKGKAQKGRAIFYPTYFNRLSLEIINPHDRKTKAGTSPIHYEVVPAGTEGRLEIVYIPFDGVLESNETIKKEAKMDKKFLIKCIQRAFENGIGAKTKLGWGRCEKIKCKIWSRR